MNALRLIAVALVVCAGAAGAQEPAAEAPPTASFSPAREAPAAEVPLAQDRGWDSRWALLFGLNNVLVVGNVLGDFNTPVGGAVGASWHLSPELAVRGGVRLTRTTNSPVIAEQVTTIGEERIVTRTHSRPSPTSTGQVALSGDVLKRMSSRAVAPYVGAGLFAIWTRSETDWRDEVSAPDLVTIADDRRDTLTAGAQGMVGAEWRVHPSFALFAEYGLRLGVYTRVAQRDRRTDESTVDGSRAVTTLDSTRNEWLNLSTGMQWGGQLGLMVHFP